MINNQNIAVLSEKVAALEAAIKNAGIELPSVTADDNGKTLQVVAGKWDKGMIIPELPEVTSVDNGKALVVGSGKWGAANVEADDVEYSSGVSVKDKLDTIDFIDETKYIRGSYTVSGTDASSDIQSFISAIVTDNKNCQFDVILVRGGKFKFTGYIYDTKAYGAGIYMDFNEKLVYWKRYNNVDTFYNISKTAIS